MQDVPGLELRQVDYSHTFQGFIHLWLSSLTGLCQVGKCHLYGIRHFPLSQSWQGKVFEVFTLTPTLSLRERGSVGCYLCQLPQSLTRT